MNITMRDSVYNAIKGMPDSDEEQVGVLTGWIIENECEIDGFYEVPNRSPTPSIACQIHKHDVPEAVLSSVIGYMHTHPRGLADPSQPDIDAMPPDRVGVVYQAHSSTFTFYNRDGFIRKETR